ncbi:AAA family ATPase [Agarilytica rhodophyticola]|uniref:AAA family ATPase n=1 Tax=Agarilytica rhodophyticola TaxID=1737490 RepID=UPI000B341204|nr:AAA family ATPase [Agarilytica rhodophyticola]
MKFVMIFGPSGIGKETIARHLAAQKGWHVFPQHLAFDIASAVVGFGNNGFEKYQRNVCLKAIKTLHLRNANGLVFTFCYVTKASDFFIEGLLSMLRELDVSAEFVRITCDLEEHIARVTSEGRKNTNKIQTKEYLINYLEQFDFGESIPGKSSISLDTTSMSAEESANEIARKLCI